jgi:O-antigen ligase
LVYEIQNSEMCFKVFNSAHNATGSVYALVCIFLLIFFLKEERKLYKLLYVIGLLICLAGLFLTKSRGSYVGFAAGLVFVFWMHFRSIKKFVISILVTAAATVPLLYFTGTYKRVMQIFDFGEANIRVRFVLWEKAWNLFTQSFATGVGFGRYNDVNGMYAQRLVGIPRVAAFFMDHNFDYSFGHAHNAYLHFLSETGIIGLGLLFLFWVLCFRKIKKGYNFSNDGFSKKVFLSSLAGIIVLFFLSLTENYLSATTAMMCISMVVSLSIGMYWQKTKN